MPLERHPLLLKLNQLTCDVAVSIKVGAMTTCHAEYKCEADYEWD
eukprot:SAG11_NODE_22856_length_399_cov_0.526667_1_plen_44_part_10